MFLKKRNLFNKLKQIENKNLTICCAPLGCGKTTSLQQYCNSTSSEVIWISLSKSIDSLCTWNEIQRKVGEFFSVEYELVRTIPNDENKTKSYVDRLSQQLTHHLLIVLDDFYEEGQGELSQFLMNFAKQTTPSNLHFVLITEKIENKRLLEYFEMKNCLTLCLADFKMTLKDVELLFAMYNCELDERDCNKVYEYTDGWLPAINISISNYKMKKSLFALHDIYDYITNELLKDYTKQTILDLAKLCIFPEFSIEFVFFMTGSSSIVELIRQLATENIFVRKKDYNIYMFSTLIKDYLKECLNQNKVDVHLLYFQAGQWYEDNDNLLKAVASYLEGKFFEKIILVLEKSDMSLMDMDSTLIQDVFNRMPVEYTYRYPYVYLIYICDCVTNLDSSKGIALLERFKSDLDSGNYAGDREQLLAEFYFIRAFSQFNDVQKMLGDFHLAFDLLKGLPSKIASKNMISTFGSCHMLYLYHHTAGTLKEVIATIRSDSKYFVDIAQGANAGCDYQTLAEYNYETGNTHEVVDLSNLAYQEAKKYRQISICISSLFIQGKAAIINEDESALKAIIAELKTYYAGNEIPIIEGELDCALSLLSLLNGDLENVKEWVKKGNVSSVALLHEAWSMSYLVVLVYHLKMKNYIGVLTCCDILDKSYQKQMHIFGLLTIKLARAIAFHKNFKSNAAKENFSELFELASQDNLVTFFLEFKEIVMELYNDYPIKSAFASTVLKLCKNKQGKTKDGALISLLTKKEYEIAKTYSECNSLQELADRLFISRNTVKTHLANIYSKLSINSRAELMILLFQKKS